jgi:5'-3' exonuclease
MGIPSYFSYIVKNHPDIIKKLAESNLQIDNLYMDCNSIIYDVIRTVNLETIQSSKTKLIIKSVILKIEEYIKLISPAKKVIIAFDGVAPIAKLEQQRNRRYKSWYQNEMSASIFKKPCASWNTSAITPGTEFMKELNEEIELHFKKQNGLLNIIVSTSNTAGEGEHKIFEYIRTFPESHSQETTVIYGLDADLIMLSINHLPISNNIYLFRETPEFIKSIDSSLESNETYLLNIPELAQTIITDMNNGESLSSIQQKNRIYDYIFLCFLLGNDFMPHFPAINIRTGGITKLLNAYKATIGNTNQNLTDGKTIYWKNVRKLVEFLANVEDDYIRSEYKLRDRREKYNYPVETEEQKYQKFEAIPNYEREIEKYINPFKDGWKFRYYKSLFKIDIDNERCRQISVNYLEGLEWTMKYYTQGCPDWRWRYHHDYPPLLQDLLKYIPYFDTEFIKQNDSVAVSPLVQLCYVLPNQSLDLLPEKLKVVLKSKYSELYPTDCDFNWAFCKYFWESHVDLPEIKIEDIENLVQKCVPALAK